MRSNEININNILFNFYLKKHPFNSFKFFYSKQSHFRKNLNMIITRKLPSIS
jgi:hypothetical protein